MIRQLEPATLFCTFSSAETQWIHLLRILGKLVDDKEYSDIELENLNWEEKCRLIQSDPVTCTRHFESVQSVFEAFFNEQGCSLRENSRLVLQSGISTERLSTHPHVNLA